MALIIDKTTGTVSREEFDRLYAEAESYISVERKRLGDNIKEILWDTVELDDVFIHRYVEDGYLVGIGVMTAIDMTPEDTLERWIWYRSPVYGHNEAGSRAWFYGEDFQKESLDMMNDDGFDRVLAIHNPTSPAAIAVSAIWGQAWEGRQYFKSPVVQTLEETFGDNRDKVGAPDTMRCFIIGKAE